MAVSRLREKNARLSGIESLRGYAAFAIMCFHVVWIGKIDPPEILRFIKWNFGFAVPLFFVVSAFSLAYSYQRNLRSARDVQAYFVKRFARIAPLFYAVLAFQLLRMWLADTSLPSWTQLIINVTFLFNLVPGWSEGIVHASWSIGVEMMFYLLFPFLAEQLSTRSLCGLLGISLVLAASFSAAMTSFGNSGAFYAAHHFIVMLPYFVIGLISFRTYKTLLSRSTENLIRGTRRYATYLFCLAFGIILFLYHGTSILLAFTNAGQRVIWDALWGIPFGMLCIAMALWPHLILSNRVTEHLGKISFSFYLVHPFIVESLAESGLYELAKTSLGSTENPVATLGVAILVTGCLVTLAATLAFQLIEIPGMNWGRRTSRNDLPLGAAGCENRN